MDRLPIDFAWPRGWTAHMVRLPWGRGRCLWDSATILLHDRLTAAELLVTAHHERHHALRGPAPMHRLEAEEAWIDEAVARELIPFRPLAEACRWSSSAFEIAEMLGVTPDLVETRLRTMSHPVERAAFRRAVAHHYI